MKDDRLTGGNVPQTGGDCPLPRPARTGFEPLVAAQQDCQVAVGCIANLLRRLLATEGQGGRLPLFAGGGVPNGECPLPVQQGQVPAVGGEGCGRFLGRGPTRSHSPFAGRPTRGAARPRRQAPAEGCFASRVLALGESRRCRKFAPPNDISSLAGAAWMPQTLVEPKGGSGSGEAAVRACCLFYFRLDLSLGRRRLLGRRRQRAASASISSPVMRCLAALSIVTKWSISWAA